MQTKTISDARRARTLAASLAMVLAATAFYANNVSAEYGAPQNAAASPSTYPRDSHGSPMLAVTAPASGRENVPAPSRGAARTATAWTSPGVVAGGPSP